MIRQHCETCEERPPAPGSGSCSRCINLHSEQLDREYEKREEPRKAAEKLAEELAEARKEEEGKEV